MICTHRMRTVFYFTSLTHIPSMSWSSSALSVTALQSWWGCSWVGWLSCLSLCSSCSGSLEPSAVLRGVLFSASLLLLGLCKSRLSIDSSMCSSCSGSLEPSARGVLFSASPLLLGLCKSRLSIDSFPFTQSTCDTRRSSMCLDWGLSIWGLRCFCQRMELNLLGLAMPVCLGVRTVNNAIQLSILLHVLRLSLIGCGLLPP